MNYKQSLGYLYHQLPMFQRQGPKAFKKDLTNIIALCERLGNPQKDLHCIHIAGTNGKGSVTHMMASILQSAGYKVGVYCSPHYKDFRERIKLNGSFIPKKEVASFVTWYQKEATDIPASFFELTVAMAFQYFKSEDLDFVVLETGLGGRLDSTNIVIPILSIITNISLDHTNFLGNTLPKIAKEKAGIIKRKVPVVIGKEQPETAPVFEDVAKNQNAHLFYAEEIINLKSIDYTKNAFEWNSSKIKLDVGGVYQIENARTAIAGVQLLTPHFDRLDKKSIVQGLSNIVDQTYFIGRWMTLGIQPLTIADSGHNQEGVKYLLDYLEDNKFNHRHIVLGFVGDKPLDAVMDLLPQENTTYYISAAKIPRALDANTLFNLCEKYGLTTRKYTTIPRAFAAAKKRAESDDLIFVGGSIFTVAEVI